MTPLVKTLLAVALVVPLVAYVAGSLAGTGAEAPERQGTVYIDDVKPVTDTTTEPATEKSPQDPRPERQDTNDGEARVVTPTPVDDDDDDDDDDERDDDRDDTDDGDDTDD